MVWKLYKQHIHPPARVVRGVPISWGSNFAAAERGGDLQAVAWSSCSRFIAVDLIESTEVLDAITLERLHIFGHPPSENEWLSFSPDSCSLTRISGEDDRSTTWDLQTGGQISAIPSALDIPSLYFSSTYSMDSEILAVACEDPDNFTDTIIATYNLISGTHIYTHRVSKDHVIAPIWTHGEFLRFATVNRSPGSITIWQVEFTSEHTLAEIESLPAPDDTSPGNRLFLPTLSRLAFVLHDAVLIWDARDSKFLLNFVGGLGLGGLSFSSDGCFFACGVSGQVHLWKESPTGYVLHRTLVSEQAASLAIPSLSPDGQLIVTSRLRGIQLWRTTDPINPPSSAHPRPVEQTPFIIAFSADKSFMATGLSGGNIAKIFDLESGEPRLIVDTGASICGLGVTGTTAVVVGEGKIITWNLPVGGCVLDARANIHDSIRTIVFNHALPSFGQVLFASISPDFNYLVTTREYAEGLDIYDMSTGKHLVGGTGSYGSRPWFTRDGREVWDLSGGQKIIRGEGTDIIGLEILDWSSTPSRGHLWESPRGHNITDEGWILDSRREPLMWLPHHWRVFKKYRVWDGRFLALLDPILPEPVVIELYR